MKKLILLLTATAFCLSMFGQAKKPTLMVTPSYVWCYKNGYILRFDNMGTIENISDYRTAIRTSTELTNVISKINILMTDRGFPLKDLSATINSIERNQAMMRAMQSNTSGATIAESPVDVLKRQANADILLELDWTVNNNRSITYNLRGLDAYTGKQIAGAQGTNAATRATDLPSMLEETVLLHIDNFTDQLQAHFDDLFENGREVIVDVMVFDNPEGLNLETEFNGYELSEIIDDWMAENTVEHRFSKSDASDNFIFFEQVRIPMYRPNGMSMDTEYFVRELSRHLRGAPYNITSKVVTRGLGRCALILGEK